MNLDPQKLAEAAQQEQQRKAQQEQMEERRKLIISQIMDSTAEERMNRLAIVKPELARTLGDSLIKAATTGQLAAKVTDETLKKMLENGTDVFGEPLQTKKKVIIQRRKYDSDDSGDNDDDLL